MMISLIDMPSTSTGYIDFCSFLFRPTPEVAFACGSRSTSRTFRSQAANEAPRLMAVVVFPTPPFWFASEMILVIVPRGTRALRDSLLHREAAYVHQNRARRLSAGESPPRRAPPRYVHRDARAPRDR